MKKQSLWNYFIVRTKSNWFIFAVLALYALFSLGSSVYFLAVGNLRDFAACLVYFLIVPVFYIAERYMHIKVPIGYFVILMLFMTFNLLGACYNLYTYIPPLDDILHATWGVVFMIFGFTVIKCVLGEPQTAKATFAYLLFGFAFCLMSSVIWEIYEFTWGELSVYADLQEDTVINSFNSFLLFPEYDHLHTLQIDGIAYTVLYDAQGNPIYTIEGGYLDIGLYDTMWDLIWCTVADFAACAVIAVDLKLGKKHVYNFLVPSLTRVKENDEQPVALTEAAATEEEPVVPDTNLS